MIDTFPNIIAFATLCVLLLAGVFLRVQIPLFRYALVPASLIGGVLGLTLFSAFDIPAVADMNFAGFTFHFFTLSFISLCLVQGAKQPEGGPSLFQGGMWFTLIWTISIVLQSMIGFGVLITYNFVSNSNVNELLGVLISHGFTQGPGQALTIGTIWEQSYSIEDAITIGLIYASFGFIAAFVIGVPIARWAVWKGLNENKNAVIDKEFTRGLFDHSTNISTGRQVTHPANIDTLAFHIAVVGLVYLITHVWLTVMQSLIGDARPYGVRIDIVFSHNLFFTHGLVVALIVRQILNFCGCGRFIDNDTQKRITGASVDFMVISTLLSIKISVLLSFLAPIMAVTMIVTLATCALCFGLGRWLPNLKAERALASFGTCTGSTGSALLLLRILDPDFSTTVSKELAFFNVAILATTFHIWAVFAPILPNLNPIVALLIYTGTLAIAAISFSLLRINQFKPKGGAS